MFVQGLVVQNLFAKTACLFQGCIYIYMKLLWKINAPICKYFIAHKNRIALHVEAYVLQLNKNQLY